MHSFLVVLRTTAAPIYSMNDEVRTALRRWAWEQDDSMIPTLMRLPVDPFAANLVARTLLARKGSERQPQLLLRYAAHVSDEQLLNQLHMCVQDGLCFAPHPCWCLIANVLTHMDGTSEAVLNVLLQDTYKERVKLAAATALAANVRVHFVDLLKALPELCKLTPYSVDAAYLILDLARQAKHLFSADGAKDAVRALVQRKECEVAVDALIELSTSFPKIVLAENGMMNAILARKTIPAVENICPEMPSTEAELLVFLRLHGYVPENARQLMVSALSHPCSEYRSTFADQLVDTWITQKPSVMPYDEQMTGSITFQPSGFTMLKAPLARVAEYFRSPMLKSDEVSVDVSKDVLQQFCNAVYYDVQPTVLLAASVARLADVFCAPRVQHLAIDALAASNFWNALDTAKGMPCVRQLLQQHAVNQAHFLSCSSRGLDPDFIQLLADYK